MEQTTVLPINTALCSFGMSGKLFHAPFVQAHPGFHLYGAWERSKQLIQELYPNALSFNNYDAILSDESIDLVIVKPTHITHNNFDKHAYLAAKHI